MRFASACLISSLLLPGLAAPAQAGPATVVTFDVGGSADAITAALADSVLDSRPIYGLDAMSIDVSPDLADHVDSLLRNEPGVTWFERGAVVTADYEIDDSALDVTQIPQAWTWTSGSPAVTVAVVDSGVTSTADLTSPRLAAGWDFVDGDDVTTDSDGHGTALANVIAAEAGNDAGSVGVCSKCEVMPVRVLDGGQGTSGTVASGITWAAAHGANVINLSLSTSVASRALREAVEFAVDRGAVIVASAGNVASTDQRYPAAFDNVLSVGQYGSPSKGQWVDVTANSGFHVLGKDGELTAAVKASGATAVTSGVAALALSLRPDATTAEVTSAIVRDVDVMPNKQPLVNAARVAYDFARDDTVAPTVTRTSLKEGALINAHGGLITLYATDDHGIARIELLVDGQVVSSARRSGAAVWLRPPTGFNGPMPVIVRAYDYAGNYSDVTTVVQADTITPTATFVSPEIFTVVHGTTIDLTVSSTATDIESVFSHYGGSLAQVAGTTKWKGRVPLDPSGWLTVEVRDKAGNTFEVSRPVSVDNLPPSGGWISPSQNARVRGTFTSKLTGVTDLGGIAKAELWANGKYLGADKTAPYALAVRTGTTSGKVKLTWRVTDRFGQARTLAARTVTADNAGPAVSITKAPANKAKVKGTVTVTVKASDPSGVARVELVVNGKVAARDYTAGYALKLTTKNRAKTLKVQVRAYDKLGNVRYTATRTWTRA
ncbi:S8 family serine peptidase [Actinoplanes sp. RD1]|uniref:S8 family serine peptidase n=1 Tax=Actinoplanes sp. RD1 TaxID=3064538 RepID=UPI0027414EC7|nr:S8 family serine peptidase [Actinoplanes sp. RD1]